MGETQGYLNLKGYYEFEHQNRPQGLERLADLRALTGSGASDEFTPATYREVICAALELCPCHRPLVAQWNTHMNHMASCRDTHLSTSAEQHDTAEKRSNTSLMG